MVATHILATVEASRLQKAVDGLVSGAFTVTLAGSSDSELRGFVKNGDGHEYGVILNETQSFCSCKDAVALALFAIRQSRVNSTVESEERKPDLRLCKMRRGALSA